MQRELLTASYDFHLPKERIAAYPASPRESAKLLVYERATDRVTHAVFSEIERFIPKNAALVFNNTKVIKARLFGKKSSGGKVELLLNRPLDAYRYSVYIKGRVKVGMRLHFDAMLEAEIRSLEEDGSRIVRFFQNAQPLRFETLLGILEKIGHIPLPPYIDRADEAIDEREYQSVFAKKEGAVAAPTASLHFSETLYKRICRKHPCAEVTLHIGSGTFKPVESEIITEHPMHSEYYAVDTNTRALIESDTPIVAVGTTSTRTIEYYIRTKEPHGEANLFLHPHNPPQRVNHLLTNFHLPRSTLLMLVASFISLDKTLALYKLAVEKKYRFFSYGDAMLIL